MTILKINRGLNSMVELQLMSRRRCSSLWAPLWNVTPGHLSVYTCILCSSGSTLKPLSLQYNYLPQLRMSWWCKAWCCYVEFVLEHSLSVSVCSRPFSTLLSYSSLLFCPSPSPFVASMSILCFRLFRLILLAFHIRIRPVSVSSDLVFILFVRL